MPNEFPITNESYQSLFSKYQAIEDNDVYFGWAPNGALTSEPKWLIRRVLKKDKITTLTWANKGSNDNVWDKRESYFK